ncbi:MAG: 2-hydroxyacyl-CoA dehydratase family protein [Desulfobacterales bacterium]|jgi:bcr-type benzoyl-CoA reductase subunit C|nr:2-hydroxyacyl-CoA dehydratase family protein [Desulfobacteraceae bacterium]MDD3991323.1 2-hydroxyacyl-CoA dehydratase family protein [Desulfobacteraceae bacterium]MDY0310624.1 2-hydroxyacyl-CoA dehydratase family protein [Desulfobacterales bacterium]
MFQLDPIFARIAADPIAYARQWKADTGRPVIGTLCSYAPEEIITAAGGLPLRLLTTGAGDQGADAHLQAYSCSLVRGALSDWLNGRLAVLDGVVFAHTCDSMQRLSDIWRLSRQDRFHADVLWPATVTGPGAEVYSVEMLREFAASYGGYFNTVVDDPALAAAADLYNRIRHRLQQLYALRRERPGLVAGGDWLAVMRTAMVMDRQTLADTLDTLVSVLAQQPAPDFEGKRLMLAGGVCEAPGIYQTIEAAGAEVVWDDLCTGWRYAAGEIDPTEAIWTALARRYLRRSVCPAKHAGLTHRADELIAAAREASADGVILLYLKFCDPHLFDYPYLKQRLAAADLPCLMVELEDPRGAEGQLRTRLEAFIEML